MRQFFKVNRERFRDKQDKKFTIALSGQASDLPAIPVMASCHASAPLQPAVAHAARSRLTRLQRYIAKALLPQANERHQGTDDKYKAKELNHANGNHLDVKMCHPCMKMFIAPGCQKECDPANQNKYYCNCPNAPERHAVRQKPVNAKWPLSWTKCPALCAQRSRIRGTSFPTSAPPS